MPETSIIKVDPAGPDEKAIDFAATLIRDGGLVAFPTETVYGIGANFLNRFAVQRLYKVKKRPEKKPFTIHISSINMINQMGAVISPFADRLMKRFWPGPLTLILNSKDKTLGFRMPGNSIAKSIISKSGVPVVAPSANISGKKPPTDAEAVLEEFYGKIDLVLDSGKTEYGKESTIVDATGSRCTIVREGAIPPDEIQKTWEEAA